MSENELGFVVRHGDHYHFIYRSQLANLKPLLEKMKRGKRTVNYPNSSWGSFHDVLDCGEGSTNYTFDDEPTSIMEEERVGQLLLPLLLQDNIKIVRLQHLPFKRLQQI